MTEKLHEIISCVMRFILLSWQELFMTVDNDNTTKSITLVVIRHALLMVMMATGMLMDYTPLNLDTTLSFVV